jgi:hypothetical protein
LLSALDEQMASLLFELRNKLSGSDRAALETIKIRGSNGNENWEFGENGLMQRRLASINDLPIREADRKYFRPLGTRPTEHPGLSDLGL